MRHHGQRIAVVCHGGVIECEFLWIGELNAGMRKRVAFPARNTAFTTWVRVQSPYDWRLGWQLAVVTTTTPPFGRCALTGTPLY
jgi:broad specificity phosphatase PhoE